MSIIDSTKTGFNELCPVRKNLYLGCSVNCRYCWARCLAVDRRQVKTDDNWQVMELQQKMLNKGWKKSNLQPVGFPSTHNITPETIDNYLIVLDKMLVAGNDVLITNKFFLSDMVRIIDTYAESPYKKQIHLLHTITAATREKQQYWEPGGSRPDERFESLAKAFINGFDCSVIMEPTLEPNHIIEGMIIRAQAFVSGQIWIGPCNIRYIFEEDYQEIWNPQNLVSLKRNVERNTMIQHEKIKWKSGFYEQVRRKRWNFRQRGRD